MKQKRRAPMTDDELGTDAANASAPEPYMAPAIEVLGSVEDLTLGPDPGTGDVPTGVISF